MQIKGKERNDQERRNWKIKERGKKEWERIRERGKEKEKKRE